MPFSPTRSTTARRPCNPIPGRLFLALLLMLAASVSQADDNLKLLIEGGNKTLKANIRHHLDVERLPCTASEQHLHHALAKSDTKMSAALRALGYYHGRWTIDSSRTGSDSACWQVRVQVMPGDAMMVTEVNLKLLGEGESDARLTAMLANLPIKTGKRLNHGRYEESKKTIAQRATNLGYLAGRFVTRQLRVNTKTNQATVNLVFDTGPRYHFGELHYPDIDLSPDFIARYQPFASGDGYEVAKIIDFQTALLNSQYFDSVSVNQRTPDDANRRVDIDVELALKSHYESTFTGGFATDTGPRVGYTLKNRHVNRQGDTYTLSSLWSPEASEMGLQYQQPGADPTKEKTLWSAAWKEESTDSAKTSTYLTEVSRVRALDNGWLFTRSLTLLNEFYDIGAESKSAALFYPGAGIGKTRSNDPRYPTKGWRLGLQARTAVEDVLSSTKFFQVTTDAKVITPLLGGRLIGRGSAGSTFVEDFSALPATLRFFAGGDNSVRGFDYKSLGPENADGEVVGGKHLLTGSLEYDHRVVKNYGLAVFYDVGSAFDKNQFELSKSAGVGARWQSPIGPIRVDLAFPINSIEGGFRLHLSMGPDL